MNTIESTAPIIGPAMAPVTNPWIALHRSSLVHHIDQCVPRGAGQAMNRCFDAIHAMLASRFLTTVCSLAAVMLVPLIWLG